MIAPAHRLGKEASLPYHPLILFLGFLWVPVFAGSLHAQILAPTPQPNMGPTPPAVYVPPVVPAPTAYPAASVPLIPTPAGPGMPVPYRTPVQSAVPSSGSLPPLLPEPQVPSASSLPSPNPSLPSHQNNGLFPSATLIPSGTVPPLTPAPTPSILPVTPPRPTPSGTVPSFPNAGPAPSIPLNTPSSRPSHPPPAPDSLPPYLQPTPLSSVPLNTPPPGTFPSGVITGTAGNFPTSLLPSVSTSPVPAASIPRIRIAKTTELETSHAPKLTLDSAVKFALAHNPDVLNSVEQIRITRGQYISIRAQLLPQLVATGSFAGKSPILVNPPRPKLNIPALTPDAAIDLGELTGSDLNNYAWNVQIGVQQLVFDGGGALSQTRAAQYLQDQSYFTLRSVIDRAISQVKIAFFQVILNRALIVVQEQSVSLLENQLEDQESRYQAGTVPKFNVLQAQVAVANAVPPLITARNNLRIAQYQLVKILGMNYQGDPTQIPFNVIGDLTVEFRKIIPDESIRIGLTRNPSLKAQRESILSQAASITAALSGYYPRITFGAGYIAQNNINFQNIGNTVEGWFFGFNGSWNIFDGLGTYGRVTTAKAQLAQAKIGYDNSVRGVILEIQQDISYLQQAQETIESQQASVVQATEALRLARERLDAGAGTQLDVLNAQVALLQAQTTVLQAKFTYLQALAQYDAALSLSTQYVETFRDPLESKEKWRFAKLNGAGYKMPTLPRVYRNQDPVRPILGPTPTPSPSMLSHQHTTRSQRSTSHP